jgi:hypothetical protein
MNTRNVLVAPEGVAERQPPFQLIDFEKAGEYLFALDPCWLAFWLVTASSHRGAAGAVPARNENWRNLPSAMLASILGEPQNPEDLGEFQLGLDLGRQLLRGWNHLPVSRDDAIRSVAQQTLRLTLIGAALAKALLHDRDAAKRSLSGSPDANRDQADRLWALIFFRVAGAAFEQFQIRSPTMLPTYNLMDSYRKLIT